jgi:hypothetical protein
VVLLAQLFIGFLYSHVDAQIFGELKLASLVGENFVGLLDTFLILDCEVGRDEFVQVIQKLKSHLRCDAQPLRHPINILVLSDRFQDSDMVLKGVIG